MRNCRYHAQRWWRFFIYESYHISAKQIMIYFFPVCNRNKIQVHQKQDMKGWTRHGNCQTRLCAVRYRRIWPQGCGQAGRHSGAGNKKYLVRVFRVSRFNRPFRQQFGCRFWVERWEQMGCHLLHLPEHWNAEKEKSAVWWMPKRFLLLCRGNDLGIWNVGRSHRGCSPRDVIIRWDWNVLP